MNDDDLDQLLRSLPRQAASPTFLRAIAEIPLRHPRAEERSFFFRPLFATFGLVFSLGLGIFVGAWSDEAIATDGTTDSVTASDTESLLDLLAPSDLAEDALEL